MAKVSIGLRGWRFDEEEVFDEDGDFRPVEDLPDDTKDRLLRLQALVDRPCDGCYLIHGEEEIQRCAPAEVVYGEPHAEVVLCRDHEPDFYYWYREAGGAAHRGEETFRDAFHEWFAAGNRAPEDYEGLEHVETDPDSVPNPGQPDPSDLVIELPTEDRDRLDLSEFDA